MALAGQKFREIVFLFLYSWEFSQEEELAQLLMRELKVTRRSVLEAKEKALQIIAKIEDLDKMIAEASTEYHIERISRVEKVAMRLSLFEMRDANLPAKVAISEGLRLVRKFASKEGASFVNAILDRIYQHGLKHRETSTAE